MFSGIKSEQELIEGEETLVLTETGTKLMITFRDSGKTVKSMGHEEAVVDFSVKYLMDAVWGNLCTFSVDNGTGEVIESSIKVHEKADIASFFSHLFRNLNARGVKSLKNS
jgi:hypothetical protein